MGENRSSVFGRKWESCLLEKNRKLFYWRQPESFLRETKSFIWERMGVLSMGEIGNHIYGREWKSIWEREGVLYTRKLMGKESCLMEVIIGKLKRKSCGN